MHIPEHGMKVLLWSKAETPRSYIVQTKLGIVRRNRIHPKERRVPTMKDQKVIRLQVKLKEVLKVPVIQESVDRPSVVKVPLVKVLRKVKGWREKSQGLCQKESKKRKRKVKVRKWYKKVKPKTPGLAIKMPHPQSQPPKPLTPKPNPIPPMEPRRSARAHKPNPRYMDAIVKEIGNTVNYLSGLSFMKAKRTINIEHV